MIDSIVIIYIKNSTEIYLKKYEAPSVKNLNIKIRNDKPTKSLLNIWDIRTQKIKEIPP